MPPPPSETSNEALKRQVEANEQQQFQRNLEKTKQTAKELLPNEIWDDVNNLKLNYVKIPDNTKGIFVGKARLPVNKSQENDFLKEVISASVLTSMGASVYLIPRIEKAAGGHISGPDAIVNGELVEFKVITGSIKKLEERFRESRTQSQNVYIRVETPGITRQDVIRKLISVINDEKYTGGYKGYVVFTLGSGREEKTYFQKIKELKR